MSPNAATIGVIGGSGFYKFLKTEESSRADTPYGKPSAGIKLAQVEGKKVAFIPRHGEHHEFPPHTVPYRANLYALKQLGADRVYGPTAVGSLKPRIKPGDFVIPDQFVNFTNGRKDTYFDGPETAHVGSADPYCPELRKIVKGAAKEAGIRCHDGGTIVVIQGPRFSSRSESKFFRSQGWDVINMTQYPEVILARELEMCYVNISLVTDYDVGLEGDPKVEPVSNDEVMKVFSANLTKLRSLLLKAIEATPAKRSCSCASAMANARIKA
ncbi:MAG TPA: S-methyl-5'-thioadenosine phosphorylase [Nitrososphaerales archaeon]|nr:S-methyl-5'-thioadenosine phosphorylase [Nitrososphaerales archaeon]HUK74738.1 S-methyl-5'-thioadenosine phosphorylase [Nitrososphaerales archaeon]